MQTGEGMKSPYISDIYSVYVMDGVKRTKLDVYLSLVSDGTGLHPISPEMQKEFDEISVASHVSKSYIAIMESEEEKTVSVSFKGKCNRMHIENKEYRRKQDEIFFKIIPGEVVWIKIDSDYPQSLRVICSRAVRPDLQNNYIEFKPGYYTIENCAYITEGKRGFPVISDIPDNTTVYIHCGAVINAAFVLENKHNIRIFGSGMISTVERCYGIRDNICAPTFLGPLRKYAYPCIFIKTDSSNISIEGITLNCEFRGVVIRNSENIDISEIKIFSNCVNADGINMMNARHIKVFDSYIHSHDDGIAVFTSCDSILYLADKECAVPLPISSDIEVARCKIITACRPFCIGGHATGNTNPHDKVENFYAHDLELINYRYYDVPEIERVKKWSGFLRILSQTEQLISNIKFKNVKCFKRTDYEGQPIHIEVRGAESASYSEGGGYRIENIIFENISFQEKTEIDLPSALYCTANRTEEYAIDGIIFDNITFGNIKMKKSDAFLEIVGNVKNITVE